ncbi:MAG: DinB family protein [Bacteroidetes bacterium]|mgnify:CR=1 FL=1|nr:DinB family protein [Bacteroidota bacterium]MBK9542151.1 DinB family protein [Bacteroidota bacterium]
MKSPVIISAPAPDEYPNWASEEILLVKDPDLISGLQISLHSTLDFFKTIPAEKLRYRYQPGKWMIPEIWQHVMDVERILAYRSLRYSRKDPTVLQGFDESLYAENSVAKNRAWEDMIHEYTHLRNSTISLFKSFTEEMTLYKGVTGQSTMSVRAAGFLILGHEIHHVRTIKERYLG